MNKQGKLPKRVLYSARAPGKAGSPHPSVPVPTSTLTLMGSSHPFQCSQGQCVARSWRVFLTTANMAGSGEPGAD